MRALALAAALLCSAVAAQAQTVGPVNPGAQVDVSAPRSVTVNGVPGVRERDTPGAHQGLLVPDGVGGYVNYAPGPAVKQPPTRDDAEEIRLFARELASQITGGLSGQTPLTGVVSIPSAFVEQDSRLATPFGRLLGEQMTYELTSRGFPVREARGGKAPARAKGKKAEPVAVLAGSYYVEQGNVFVNARLVEPGGRVLRTGSVLMPMTPVLRRILGLAEPTGLRPTPPTLIGARDVNDPPGSGAKAAMPYTPSAPKKAAPPRKTAKKPAAPCPPGCEPIDTAAKAAPSKPPKNQAAEPQAQQPQPAAPQQPKPGPAPQ